MAEHLRKAVQKYLDLVSVAPPASICGVLNGAPHPDVRLNGIGVVALPVERSQAINLVQVGGVVKGCLRPIQGAGASSRPCRIVERSQFTTSTHWETAIAKLVPDAMRALGAGGSTAKLRKCRLMILERNARFTSEMDTRTSQIAFATLIMKLPSFGDGGEVIGKHDGAEHHYNLSGYSGDTLKWAAFRNDCEFEIRPLKETIRFFLLYSLESASCVSQAPLHRQPKRTWISEAFDIWERIPHKERPTKLIIPLKARYTKKTLLFCNLKRDDAITARHFRESKKFSILLVSLTNAQRNIKESHADEGVFTQPSIRQMDHNRIQNVIHVKKRDSGDAQFFVTKIVDECDNEVEQFDMKIDEFRDIVLNSGPLQDNVTASEYIQIHSSRVTSTCEASALVVWPKNADFAILCQSNFISALQFLRSAALVPSKFAVETLRTAIGFIAVTGNWRKYLIDMLEISCRLKNCECALEALNQMSTPSKSDEMSSSWRTSNFGCSSERQIRAMGSAILLFNWERLGPAIIEVVESTSLEKLSCAAEFAMKAKGYGLTAEAVNVVNETVMGLLLNQEGFERSSMSTAKFVFSCPSFCEQQEKFLDKAKNLPTTSIVGVIRGIDAALEETGICEGALRALRTLVEEYIHKAINEFCEARKICGSRNFFPYLCFEEDVEKGENLAKVFSIVLHWRRSIEPLLHVLVEKAVSMENSRLLKLLVQCDRLPMAVDDTNVRKLVQTLMNHLDYPKPSQSNRQTGAYVQNHELVTEFLRGDQLKFSYSAFAGVREAREFVTGRFYREFNEVEQHSASATVVGRGSEATVILQKTNKHYLHKLKVYEEDQGELRRLSRLLRAENRKRQKTSHSEGVSR